MLHRFLKKTDFVSAHDFQENYQITVPSGFNFAYDIVDVWAAEAPEKRAMCWTNDKGDHIDFTFLDLKENSDRAASFFQSQGIGKGDKVMLILKRNYEYWFAILGLHKLGAVTIPATHLLTEKDIIYRNNTAGVKAIVCANDAGVMENIDKARSQSDSVEKYIVNGPSDNPGWISFTDGTACAAPFVRPEHVNENEDLMLLYFTSGTTGDPKMVAHNFTYPLAHITTAAYWHHLNQDSLHLTIADTGWAKSAWGKLYGQWITGAAVFVYDHEKFTPAGFLHLIEKYRITSFCAPPTVYRFMIREDLSKFDLSCLQECTTAGEALNPSVFESFYKATGVKIREAFGQTETTPLIITFPWIESVPGAMGIAANPQYRIKLIAADGCEAKVGEPGELVVDVSERPLGLFAGYYRDEEKTRSVFSEHGYHTGDIAIRDEAGYFWYVGRADDIIKSSGYRIGPFEVESALMTHEAVVECAITGVPDDIRGQVVKATIILAEHYRTIDPEVLKTEIQEHVKRTTAPYKYPRIIEFVDKLPKTVSGKIKRFEIRKGEDPAQ